MKELSGSGAKWKKDARWKDACCYRLNAPSLQADGIDLRFVIFSASFDIKVILKKYVEPIKVSGLSIRFDDEVCKSRGIETEKAGANPISMWLKYQRKFCQLNENFDLLVAVAFRPFKAPVVMQSLS